MAINLQRITELVNDGYISARRHESLPFTIYNYTSKTQFEAYWTPETLMCRGLIVADDDEIVARPFDKFFNWNERGLTTDADIVNVTEKMDGSLGILYRGDTHYPGYEQVYPQHISTRGSFDSEQALWATEKLKEYFAWVPNPLTALFEIIYPDNRVVVDYGERETLCLLALRNRFTGEYLTFEEVKQWGLFWGIPTPKTYHFDTPEQIAGACAELDSNNEGWVAEFSDGQRFKFKGNAYVELHRLIHGISFKRILEAIEQGRADEYLAKIPEEFRDQAEQWRADIETKVHDTLEQTHVAFKLAPKTDRKAFALWTMENVPELSAYMFKLLDRHDPTPLIYKREF